MNAFEEFLTNLQAISEGLGRPNLQVPAEPVPVAKYRAEVTFNNGDFREFLCEDFDDSVEYVLTTNTGQVFIPVSSVQFLELINL